MRNRDASRDPGHCPVRCSLGSSRPRDGVELAAVRTDYWLLDGDSPQRTQRTPRTASADFSDEGGERMRWISRIDSMEGESAHRNEPSEMGMAAAQCHPERQRSSVLVAAALATITVEKIPRGCSG